MEHNDKGPVVYECVKLGFHGCHS